MNKKLMTFGILGLFALALVSAAVYIYVGTTPIDATVNEALSVSSGLISVSGYPGETQTEEITITNLATVPLNVNLDYVEQSNDYVLESSLIYYGEDGYIGADFGAGKDTIRILTEETTLGTLGDISFEQYATEGYPVSVNILLDVNGDGEFESKKDLTTGYLTTGADDVLKIEFFGNGATAGYPDAYMEEEDYNKWLQVWGNGVIDDTTVAWLYSVSPGDNPVNEADEQVDGTLANWELGIDRGTSCYYVDNAWHEDFCEDITIDSDTIVYGIEIESLGWIAESSSKIRNIKIGGELTDALGVEYTNNLPDNPITIPSGEPTIVSVEFTMAGDSPIGKFTGIINVERTA